MCCYAIPPMPGACGRWRWIARGVPRRWCFEPWRLGWILSTGNAFFLPLCLFALDLALSIASLSPCPIMRLLVLTTCASEEDPWFVGKKRALSSLQTQLRSLRRHIDQIASHRRDYNVAVVGFWDSVNDIHGDSDAPAVFASLAGLGKIQLQVDEMHAKQSEQYVTQFGAVVDEYLRFFESIRFALESRDTAWAVRSVTRGLLEYEGSFGRLTAAPLYVMLHLLESDVCCWMGNYGVCIL